MFDNFPYTDMHQLNLDWIIKIAKDFLDQYTHIQELITNGIADIDSTTQTGLESLQEKAEQLETLLQEWYNTHSEDIADELADAIDAFRTQAQAIGADVIASIPADYSTLATNALQQRGVRQNEGDTVLTDFDNAASNKVYTITSTVGVSHCPSSYGGTLLTFNGDSTYTSGCAQLYYDTNGQVYYRIRWGGSGGTWSNWQTVFASIGTRQNQGDSVLTDFNNAISNKIYTITDGTGIAHAPTDGAGTLFSMNATSGAVNGTVQYFESYDGRSFHRICWNNTWTSWKEAPGPDSLVLKAIGARQNEGGTVLTDFNNATANRVYTFGSMAGVSNAPTTNTGTLITMNGDPSYSNGQAQLFITNSQELFFRIKWNNAWTGWIQTTPFNPQGYYAGIDIFEKFCIIGDSFATGYICTSTDTEGSNHWYLSWGRMIARRHNITCHLQARGGYSTYDFVNPSDSEYNNRGLGKLISDTTTGNADDMYIIAMGINDSNSSKTFGNKQGGLTYIGSSLDINLSDPTQNANSFWGNMGRIIQTIRTNSPTSRVVLSTFCRLPSPNTAEAYDAFIQAIKEIATFFELPCIELTDDPFFKSPYYLNNMVGYHPTAPQYVGYSYAMERLLSRCMVNNYLKFYEWTGMPT